MTAPMRRLLLVALLPAMAAAVVGCNEDGQDIGAGKCNSSNSLPLYRWEYDAGQWSLVGLDGKPLSNDDLTKIQQASQSVPLDPKAPPKSTGLQRCITPRGTALTLDAGKD